jgi:hypothetical protein
MHGLAIANLFLSNPNLTNIYVNHIDNVLCLQGLYGDYFLPFPCLNEAFAKPYHYTYCQLPICHVLILPTVAGLMFQPFIPNMNMKPCVGLTLSSPNFIGPRHQHQCNPYYYTLNYSRAPAKEFQEHSHLSFP